MPLVLVSIIGTPDVQSGQCPLTLLRKIEDADQFDSMYHLYWYWLINIMILRT